MFQKWLNLLKDIQRLKKTPTRKVEFSCPLPTEEEIRILAYQKWEQAQPSDKPSSEFWDEAEQELKGNNNIKTF